MALVILVGFVVVFGCLAIANSGGVGRKASLAFLGLAAIIVIAALKSCFPEKEPEYVDDPAYNDPSSYEESQDRCWEEQKHTYQNLYCD